MIKVGRMVQGHLWGIPNVTQLEATRSIAESVNEMIQKIKERGCGYRDRARSRMAIVFHNGGGPYCQQRSLKGNSHEIRKPL